MKNYRGTGDRVVVTAAAARTSGQLVVEDQFVGVAETSPLNTQRYALRLTGEFEVPLASGAAKGDQVFISTDGNNTVGRAAAGTAIGAGTRYVGRVTAIPTNSNTTTANIGEPATGKMWVKLGTPAA